MRKRPRRAPAMLSTPGDQKVNVNMIVKAPRSAIWRKNASIFCVRIDVRQDENRAVRVGVRVRVRIGVRVRVSVVLWSG